MNNNSYFLNNENNRTGMERTPVAPLPNPGEGGPIGPGQGGNRPVAPLPNPGEGGPVGPGQGGNRPVAPLPNPGEGGPVGPGQGGNRPVAPLPNPGEGGPVGPGQGGPGTPVTPLPNPGEGGPVGPGQGGPGVPVIPLPNPGEGGPVTGTLFPNLVGTIISTYPRPTEPCAFCGGNNGNTAEIRFLNAVSGYPPFIVYFNQNIFVNPISFSEVTEYEKVSSGIQTITVAGENGYIYLQKPISIPTGEAATIAIFPTDSGMDIMLIVDSSCNRTRRMSCVRACNLSHSSGPLNVVIGEQYLVFNNIRFMEVTSFMNIWPAEYLYHVTRGNNRTQSAFSGETLLTANIVITRNRNYTIYLMNWKENSPASIKAMVVEEL